MTVLIRLSLEQVSNFQVILRIKQKFLPCSCIETFRIALFSCIKAFLWFGRYPPGRAPKPPAGPYCDAKSGTIKLKIFIVFHSRTKKASKWQDTAPSLSAGETKMPRALFLLRRHTNGIYWSWRLKIELVDLLPDFIGSYVWNTFYSTVLLGGN